MAVNAGSTVLSQNNFSVFENGLLQTDYFQVTPPQFGSGSRLTDIVFLMDNSGSMGDDQAAVRNNVLQFVDNLSASGVNYALGLCRFGMYAGGGNPVFVNSGQLTQDAAYFKNTLWSYNVVDGSREPGYDAVVQSSSAFNFRPGAQKVFIVITDEHPNQGTSTVNDVLSACSSKSITLFVLTLAELNSYFTAVTAATHGAIFDIHANFNTILQYISSQVSNNYVVQYRSSNPVADGVERRVEIRIAWNGEQVSVYGSYIPGAVPRIIRSAATIALEQQAWAAGSSLTIEIEAIDLFAPYVSAVLLYYRTTGTGGYLSTPLNQVTSTLWRGQIPTSVVNSPGVDYYLTASDGITTVSAPAVNPIDSPFQIAILPNVAPEITHTPIARAARGMPLSVTTEARDGTNRLASVFLNYKRTGQLTYQSSRFSLISGNTYQCTIPAEYVTVGGVDYFIKAWDDLGVSSSHGTFDQPHYISTSGGGSWQPLLLDPVAGKVGMGIEVWLSWEASTGATAYRVELDDASDFSSPEFHSTISETRVYVDDLDYSSKYYWRVQAKNSQSTSEWSQVYNFTTMAEPPVKVIAPDQYALAYLGMGDQCYADRDYMLGAVPAALRYNLYIKTANWDKNRSSSNYITFELTEPAAIYIAYDLRAGTPPDWLASDFIRLSKMIDINELDGSITSMGLWKKSLLPGTHTLGGNLATGAAGARTNFLVLFSFDFDPFTPIQIVAPADSERYVAVNPTLFKWRKITGALWYDFNLSTAKSSSKVIAYDFGLTDTTYRVNTLELNKTYYWRLRASGKDRSTDWSEWHKFTTGTAPTLIGIAITGPAEVRANSSADYFCYATFSDGSTKDVTALATWTENSNFAELSGNGHLVTTAVDMDKNFTLSTQYAGQNASLPVKIRKVKIPIVFIPGIMGSPLYNDRNGDGLLSDLFPVPFGEQIWINTNQILFELPQLLIRKIPDQDFLLPLQLNETGELPFDPSDQIKAAPLRGDNQNSLEKCLQRLPLSTYNGFFQHFKQQSYVMDTTANLTPASTTNLFCYSYDWRRSIAWNGEQLSAAIDQILQWTRSSQVILVAHSMGGLVAKSCIKDFNPDRINKVIFIGTPHLGAPKIYYTMLTGEMGLGWGKELILNNTTIKRITRNMPSVYQLFPSVQFFDPSISNGGANAGIYNYSLIRESAVPLQPTIGQPLAYADAIHYFKELKYLGNPLYNDGLLDLSTAIQNDLKTVPFGKIKVFNIVGYGTPTIGHIELQSLMGLFLDCDPLYNMDGDGTVPLKSAESLIGTTFQPIQTFYCEDSEHSGMASDDKVMRILDMILQDSSDPSGYGVPGHYNYACDDTWQTIVACPVVVHVYDNENRHTGPVSGNLYEEEIPGSHYVPVNLADPQAKKIFLLPYGGSYRFEITAQDTIGLFDFHTYEIINGAARAMLAFDSVRFTPATRAYCEIRPFLKQISMKVDQNGDGKIDTTYQSAVTMPSAVGAAPAMPLPRNFSLSQNYPNPFNSTTTIQFALPQEEVVLLELYNIGGQKITTLLHQRMAAGVHQVSLEGRELATGVYLCRIVAGPFSQTVRIALLR